MRKMLCALLLLPLGLFAQRDDWDIAYEKNIFTGLGERIRLPDRGFSPFFEPDTFYNYRQKQRVYIISADSTYRKLFWQYRFTKDSLRQYANDKDPWYYQWMVKYLSDSLPVIDFLMYDLVLYTACAQCQAYCNHLTGEESCHRNVCTFRESWFLRKKDDSLITGN